jgi:hypothetical protein
MPHRIVYSVTRLRGQAAIIRKTVELLDYLITSIVHVLSFWLSFGITARTHPLPGRDSSFE